MKAMKKIFALVLTLALVLSMSTISAFAASPITTIGGTDSATVKGTYSATGGTDVYSVDITWGNMEFTYNAGTQVWNTSTHEWDLTGTPTWTVANPEDNKIEIKSHSSKAVTATLSFVANSVEGLTGSFKDASTDGTAITNNQFAIAAATAATANATPDAIAYLQLSGGSVAVGADDVTIGTVTVTLS